MNKKSLIKTFLLPLLVLIGIGLYLLFSVLNLPTVAVIIILVSVVIGSFELFKETVKSILKRQYALDYIAIVAIVVAVITKQYLVAGILALMISSGRTLEEYGVSKAKYSLTNLAHRIPNEVLIWAHGQQTGKKRIDQVTVGEHILVRKGEVIPLDGVLESENGLTDESTLTGEPYFIEKMKGDTIRSGTINTGNPMVVTITKTSENSTYTKILKMVEHAEAEKSPFVRLADRYSTYFTLISFALAGFAYILSGFDLTRVLAVLAIATPCPLIIATPIALLGGVNAASKKRIIIKKLASLESLAKATVVIFDKTGTITLGIPKLTSIHLFSKDYSEKEILSIAQAIERNSLHPLAKAIVAFAKGKKTTVMHAHNIEEKIGIGITGIVNDKEYALASFKDEAGMSVALFSKQKELAVFRFEDEIKKESAHIIKELKEKGYELYIFTGDTWKAAQRVVEKLGQSVVVKADCTPEEKKKGIEELKKQHKTIAMVGDGINDAPALALSDVGMVFSNQEQTAASEAADVVFLGGDFGLVRDSLVIAKRTIKIARQSILWGIGLSIIAMIFASLGYIPPIVGAGLQEAIDVAVILNALRATRL